MHHSDCSRRQGVVYSGAAFAGGGFIDDWSYDDRNQVVGADRRSGTDANNINMTDTLETTANEFDRRYTYDTIGNRTASDAGVAIEDPNQPAWSYTANSLNQYSFVSNPTLPLKQFSSMTLTATAWSRSPPATSTATATWTRPTWR